MTSQEMKIRTRQFALRVIRSVQNLPSKLAAEIIGKQLLQSAANGGANYCLACRAKSTADLVNKLWIVEEQTRGNLVKDLINEAHRFFLIVVSSIKTSKSNRNSQITKKTDPQSEFHNPKSL